MTTCPDCHGTGYIVITSKAGHIIAGEYQVETTRWDVPCATCEGSGEVAATQYLEPQP